MNPDPQLLADVVAETLEQFAFLFGEPAGEGEAFAAPGAYLEAGIGFEGGGERGYLTIAAPLDMCREMAGNVLGMDAEEVPDDAVEDAIKELANVLVGSLSARRLGVRVSCTLDPPVAREVAAERVEEMAATEGALRFRIDEHLFVALLDERPSAG